LRFSALGSYPKPHATNDEYSNLWAGSSILNGSQPVAWSLLKGLPKANLLGHYQFDEDVYPLYQPYFDHPPVFQITTGLVGRLLGSESYKAKLRNPTNSVVLWDIPLWKLRLLPLSLYAISFWLLWNWVRLASGPFAALLSAALYGFVYSIVIHQRLVVSDNLVVPLLLGSMVILEKARKNRAQEKRTVTYVACAIILAVLTKLLALAIVPCIALWSYRLGDSKRAFRITVVAIGASIIAILLFAFYGWVLDWDGFVATMQSQSKRFAGFIALRHLFSHHPNVHSDGFSAWIFGGWILVFALVARSRSASSIQYACLGYLAGYIFLAPDGLYGWYHLTFFPFLCASWGTAIRGAIRAPMSPLGIILLMLLVPAAFQEFSWLSDDFRSAFRYAYAIIIAIIVTPFPRFGLQKLTVLRYITAIALGLGLSAQIVLLLRDQYLN